MSLQERFLEFQSLCDVSNASHWPHVQRIFTQKQQKYPLNEIDTQRILQVLAELLLYPEFTVLTLTRFRSLIYPLVLSIIVPEGRDYLAIPARLNSMTNILDMMSNILPLHSQIAQLVCDYLENNKSLLETTLIQISQESNTSSTETQQNDQAVVLLRALQRLLINDRDLFEPFVKLHNMIPLLYHKSSKVRLYAMHIFCHIGRISDHGRSTLERALGIVDHDNAWQATTIMTREDQLPHQVEMMRYSLLQGDEFTSDLTLPLFLTSRLVSIKGLTLPKKSSATKPASASNPYVFNDETPNASQNMESLILAVALRSPVLLKGPHSCGKTTIVEGLAHLTGNHDLVKIHLGDHVDSKLLLGSYICTEVPGEFKWQAGALTQAVANGRWVVIEDIDLAPHEVIQSLHPLLEDRHLFIPGRGEYISVGSGFQLFATLSTTNKSIQQTASSLGDLWTHVEIKPLPLPEICVVINTKYPKLAAVSQHLSRAYQVVQEMAIGMSSFSSRRTASIRDLFKLSKRLATLYDRDLSLLSEKTPLSGSLLEGLFCEALDCFAGISSEDKLYLRIAESIGEIFHIPHDRISFYTTIYKPHFEKSLKNLRIGRLSLPTVEETVRSDYADDGFVKTKHHLRLLEKIAVCVRVGEPVLLAGETGTGKTTVVQYLAQQLGQKLIVQNMSQQTDSMDLIGGFKPIDMKILCAPLVQEFDQLFQSTFSAKTNGRFLDAVHHQFQKQNWKKLLQGFNNSVSSAMKKLQTREESSEPATKLRKFNDLAHKWEAFSSRVQAMMAQQEQVGSNFAFTFMEGPLAQAVQRGDWILLDEVNLASAETLERLSSLLEGDSLIINERGDIDQIVRHPNFRLFACMNPATDAGKKDLPPGLRNRFSEFYVDEMRDSEDLRLLVTQYLRNSTSSVPQDKIVDFYQVARKEAHETLYDGSNNRPVYSLRTLTRALRYAQQQTPTYGFLRALYDGFCMSFLTQLNQPSISIMEKLVRQEILGKAMKAGLKPPRVELTNVEVFEGFFIERGEHPIFIPPDFIITDTIKSRLSDLARIVSTRRHPVLIQGATSTGKTSLVEYLAGATGHRFVRINNHEHTDIQEYLGSYSPDTTGKLIFQEGILVEAVRKGYWIVLDELNLAPSEILEALNRLLDDNRELFIPEKNEVVRPHPHFQLFATQNPAGIYGGRKILSKAFRNRFVELHYDDIPTNELEFILHKRCLLSPSCAKTMISIMKDLERGRFGSQVFAGKRSYITPRDLFRWGNRIRAWEGDYHEPTMIAYEGYIILAERLRKDEEKQEIRQLLEKHTKVKIEIEKLYQKEMDALEQACSANPELAAKFSNVVWTSTMKRMYSIVSRCLKNREPILLVGETGCGKTTVCQILALARGQKLHMLNCHQHTETADFLGGLRPVRGKDIILGQMRDVVKKAHSAALQMVSVDLDYMNDSELCQALDALAVSSPADSEDIQAYKKSFSDLRKDYSIMFSWQDGPLVEAMKNGDLILVDEISLAEDSVLERLNSVLETKQILVLAEKGGPELEEIIAKTGFCVLATMNPGGDFGKKELSPALRNRFTEIWIGTLDDNHDLLPILNHQLAQPSFQGFGPLMLQFIQYYRCLKTKKPFTIRDALSWANFMVKTHERSSVALSYVHGACMIFLDNIGSGTALKTEERVTIRNECLRFLIGQLENVNLSVTVTISSSGEPEFSQSSSVEEDSFGVNPFYIPKGHSQAVGIRYSLDAPTTSRNVVRVLRGMQLRKPILLEGSPGVGKTSLVTAIAKASGHTVVRINLSEQTDISDLMGADLPVEGGNGGEFSWRDGVFLQAMKAGHWILLDELNLASQSVLEGLNACLDHRGTVFIPELNMSFEVSSESRIFGCQNPMHQGGGRKGLPKSFLNRFTEVYVEQLESADLLLICKALFPMIEGDVIQKMISFNESLHRDTMIIKSYGRKGSPWEFNLRDLQRWCEMMIKYQKHSCWNAGEFVSVMYYHRMRTNTDRDEIKKLYSSIFGEELSVNHSPSFLVEPEMLQIGTCAYPRKEVVENTENRSFSILQEQLPYLEALLKCVDMRWMSILIGPSGSGKTAVIRQLAQLTGNKLCEFSMNSSVDTLELLGGFEQIDLNRHQTQFVEKLDALVRRLLTKDISSQHQLWRSRLGPLQSVLANVQLCKQILSGSIGKKDDQATFGSQLLAPIEQVFRTLTDVFADRETLGALHELKSEFEKICALENHHSMGRFEWVDGVIVQALTHGHWLLIDNANICNPSVLDRLNSLFENDGELILSERGIVGKEVVTVKPHPDFRIFLTIDPANGELSRAMRNRGIEICMLDSVVSSRDTLLLLSQTGMIGDDVLNAMVAAHQDVCKVDHHFSANSRRELIRWATIAREMLERGNQLPVALSRGFDYAYRLLSDGIELAEAKRSLFQSHLSFLHNASRIPGWSSNIPVYTTSKDWAFDSTRTRIYNQGIALAFANSKQQDATFSPQDPPLHASAESMTICKLEFNLVNPHTLQAMSTSEHKALYHRFFLEHSSNTEAHARLSFARRYSSNGRAAVWVAGMSHVFDKLSALEKSTAFCKALFLFDYQDLSLNAERMKPMQSDDASLSTLHQEQNLYVIYHELISLMIQRFMEQASYESIPSAKVGLAVIFQSYLYHQGLMDKDSLSHPIALFAYPFQQTLGLYLEKLLSESSQMHDKDYALINELTSFRSHLWSLLSCPQFCLEKVSNILLRIQKRLIALNKQQSTSQEESAEILSILNHVTSALGVTAMRKIQKHMRNIGRYPPVFQLSELASCYDGLLESNSMLEWNIRAEGGRVPLLYTSSEIKTLLLDCLSTASFLVHKKEISLSEQKLIIESVLTIHQRLSDEMNAITSASAQPFDWELEHRIEGWIASHQLWSLLKAQGFDPRTCIEATWPLQDALNLLSESDLLIRIKSLMSLSKTEQVESQILSFVEQESHGSRPPVDFVPYKLLAWMLSAKHTGDITFSASEMTFMINRFASMASLVFYRRLWMATFNNKNADANIDYGPSFLLSSQRSALTVAILGDLAMIPLVGKERKLAQISYISRQLSNSKNRSFVSAEILGAIQDLQLIIHDLSTMTNCAKSYDFSSNLRLIVDCLDKSNEITENCIVDLKKSVSDLQQFYTQELSSQIDPFLEAEASEAIRKCLEHMLLALESDNVSVCIKHSSVCRFYMGIVGFLLNAPTSGVDPISKYSSKMDFSKHSLDRLTFEKNVRHALQEMIPGARLRLSDLKISKRMHELNRLQSKLKQKIAARPDVSVYPEIHHICSSFKEAMLNSDLQDLIDQILSLQQLNSGSAISVLEMKETLWQQKLSSAIDRLSSRKFNYYLDVTSPILLSLYQIKHGLRNLASPFLTSCQKLNQQQSKTVSSLVDFMAEFPANVAHKAMDLHVNQLMDPVFLTRMQSLQTGSHMNLIRIALTRLLRNLSAEGALNQSLYKQTSNLLSAFVMTWDEYEEKARQKQEEEDQLYQTKIKKIDIKSDDVLRDEDFQKRFPDYHKEYDDVFVDPEELDQVKPGDSDSGPSLELRLSKDDIVFIKNIHRSIFDRFSAFRVEIQDTPLHLVADDFRISQQASRILRQGYPYCPDFMLKDYKTTDLLQCDMMVSEMMGKHSYRDPDLPVDIYHDPDPQESILVVEILQPFVKKVEDLLEQFPEHPLLSQIRRLCQRILSFSLATPFMKVLIGLELLLRKANEWEAYASRHVTVNDHITQVSRLVQRWRKKELDNWKNTLDTRAKSMQTEASRWWLYLYKIITAPFESASTIIIHLFDTLDKFMQTSPIGEFTARLELLYSFHRQMEYEENCSWLEKDARDQKKLIKNILYNVYRYYSFFVERVLEELRQKRGPIEKELEDFIKIARWDDVNYYAIKESSEKAHRKLHKLGNDFEEALKAPVLTLLGASIDQWSNMSEMSTPNECALFPMHTLGYRYSHVSESEPKPINQELSRTPLGRSLGLDDPHLHQNKMPAISSKIAAVSSSIQSQTAARIESLSVTIIETVQELREETKFKTAKVKAFVDLLRNLKRIGLSYLAASIPKDALAISKLFSQEPFSKNMCDTSDPYMDVALQVDRYFYRNIHKLQYCRQASAQPTSQDLSRREVSVSSQFAEHLFYMASMLRKSLAHGIEQVAQLECRVGNMSQIDASSDILAHQTRCSNWISAVSMKIEVATAFFKDLLLLSLIKENKDLDTLTQKVVQQAAQARQFLLPLRNQGHTDDIHGVSMTLLLSKESLASITLELQKLKDNIVIWCDGATSLPSFVKDGAQKQLFELQQVAIEGKHMIDTLEAADSPDGFDESLEDFKRNIAKTLECLMTSTQKVAHDSEEPNISDPLFVSSQGTSQEDDNPEELGDNEVRSEFDTCMMLLEDVKLMNLNRCFEGLSQAIAKLSFGPTVSNQAVIALHLVQNLCCVANKFVTLCKSVLERVARVAKSMMKMDYILINLFVNLYNEGYCDPKDEEEGQGENGEVTSRGTGLGEGQGEKDISDQIEDEDQLLGSKQKDKQEEKQEKSKEKKQEDSGIEVDVDFEGEFADIEQNPDEENEEDEDEDEKKEELDRQMGDLEQNEEEVVDEKFWDEKDGEDETKPEEEKRERDSSLDGNPGEVDIVAKDEEDDGKKDEKKKKDKPEKDTQPDPQETENDQNADEEEEEHINEDGSEKYEDNHGINPDQPKDLELPDELNLDQDGDSEDGSNAEENVENPEDAMSDEENPGDDHEDGKKSNSADEIPMPEPEETPEEPISQEEPKVEGETANEEQQNENQNTDQIDSMEDKNVDDTPAPMNEEAGVPSASQIQQENQNEVNGETQGSVSTMTQEPTGETSSKREDHPATEQDRSNHTNNRKKDVNPFRSLGDAAKEWMRRAKVEDSTNKETKNEEQNQEKEIDPSKTEFEFIEDNEQKEDAQVMAPADESQMKDAQLMEESDKEDSPQDKDEDEADTTKPEQPAMGENRQPSTKKDKQKITRENDDDEEMEESDEIPEQDALAAELPQPMEGALDEEEKPSLLQSNLAISDPASIQKMTPEELQKLRDELENELAMWRDAGKDEEKGELMWRKFCDLTADSAQDLCEKLRLILEPTLSTKLKGDYKSGKRINMKKVIPYIASHFKKDKIWMRRTKPSKRTYQVMLAIDDSLSMRANHAGDIACEALTLITRALSRLEVGQMSVVKFGEEVNVLHSFDSPFTDESGARVLREFSFNQQRTNYLATMKRLLHILELSSQMAIGGEPVQLTIIVSDGHLSERSEELTKLIREATSRKQLLVFIILDHASRKNSVLTTQSISYRTDGKITTVPYLDLFPFPYYIILREIHALPEILADALRQWFQMITSDA
eukprot:TRINITY_DN3035_c0_g2_i1.p1 TRINITY_DN3035_c0_g2~~TRINITY_DN3035_c0_g2_i1.p1  ORF type:complete len:5322 (+),score=1048.10 TRINITY_DN3035_c0_g2_i1:101-16066(+)